MSSTPRTANRGANKSKSDSKGHKSDTKRDGPKNNDSSKAQASSERTAYNSSDFGTDELSMKKRISCIMDVMVNARTEDEVVTALHDCDNDIDKAVTMLLEATEGQGAWKKCGKKRKNRQANAAKTGESTSARPQNETEVEDWDTPTVTTNQDRDRSRGRGGNTSRPRGRGGADNRGSGRGRENKENEGTGGGGGEDGPRGGRGDGYRRGGRGMSNGPGGRGGRGGRGGGGRLGSRTFQGRDGRGGGDSREKSDGDRFPSTIDTWNPPGSQDTGDKSMKMETWNDKFPAPEDWDNEEYTGSLADSQVFTKSALDGVGAPDAIPETTNQDLLAMTTSTSQDFHQSNALSSATLSVGVGVLTSAQAQYLTKLTQQTSENRKATAAAAVAATVYGQTESLKSAVGIGGSTSYGQSTTYGQPHFPPSSSLSYPAAGFATTSASGNAYSAPNAYSASAGAFPQPTQGYQSSNTSSYGPYPSSGGSFPTQNYVPSNAVTSYDAATTDANATISAQPQRAKVQRPRMPPPSKIPSSAVEMPEDPISSSVSSLDVQFGGLEFGSDGTSFDAGVDSTKKFSQPIANSSVDAVTDATATNQQASLNAYSATKSAGTGTNQPPALVAGLAAKGLSNNEGLSIQSSTGDLKQGYNSQQPRAANSTSSFDLTKTDVGNLTYGSTQSGGNYANYQNQKSSNSGYPSAQSYSTGSYAASQTTYSSSGYNNQSSANSSYNSQAANPTSYNVATGASYTSNNSFPNASQNYQSGTASGYGTALASSYTVSSFPTSYSTGTSATNKLNSGLSTTKESTQEYLSSTTTSTTASSLLTITSNSVISTASATKTSSSTIKSNVVPSMHPQMMGGPQYIMSGTSMPFYPQTPMYNYAEMVESRIPYMQPGYFDVAYPATSMATGRDTNVAYTVADARYSTRAENNASPVPSTLSQQNASGHQQPMMNNPLPPGYTYVFNPLTSVTNFQYGGPLYPVQSAGNAHGASSNFGKATYGSSYASGYDSLNQAVDFKNAYVSGGVKSGVGGVSVTSATTVSDLYGKPHAALGKVNSYDKQGFHSATPPPFNLATGQGPGGYGPPLFIPTIPSHQQHPTGATALMPSHLQDSTNSSGQRSQSVAQPNKSGNKQSYSTYWAPNN